ncbi:hypothetical protein AAIH46_13250 [Rhizobium sp. 0TCS1.26]|uniref:hypothetical protein n=1 Tax=Rhizobium sp. 0TCS1.26 TaxID=3142623 RepID=UPI003D2A63A4
MAFILPKGVRDYFGFDNQRAFARSRGASRDAVPRFLMFDAYYCCLMLGLDTAMLGDESALEPVSFLPIYPETYRGQVELIAALLVDAELRRLRIDTDDRDDIERQMVQLLDLSSVTRLSSEGDSLLNRYAASGFNRLRDGILKVDNLEDFLVAYHALWNGET